MLLTQNPLNFLIKRHTGWIGIDIGTNTIKMAQVRKAGEGWEISDAAIVRVDDGESFTDPASSNSALAQLIRKELSDPTHFRGRAAACVLPITATELRMMQLPVGNYSERRQMVEAELEGAATGAGQPVEFDFWETAGEKSDATSELSNVNVLSIDHAVATRIATGLLDAGLECQVLDGAPQTLARALQMLPRSARVSKAEAILDWGCSAALLTISAAGTPSFTRTLRDCGHGVLLKSLISGLNMEAGDCQEILTKYGLPDPQSTQSQQAELQKLVAELTADGFHRLVQELQKTLSFLRMQQPELVPEKLWLSGGGATVKHCAAQLAAAIGIPVENWRLPLRATGFLERIPAELLASAAALSALAWES